MTYTGPEAYWPDTDKDWLDLLDWLYRSPPLLVPPSNCSLLDDLLAPREPGSTLIQEARSALAASPDKRLGKLFEILVGLAISAQPELEILARNMVINGADRTLGELDMILANQRDGSVIHVEITLKFYLGLANGRFPGPNPADTLEQKYHRLASHQLPLSRQQEACAQVSAVGLPQVTERRLFSRGRLFYPMVHAPATPAEAWPTHQQGDWWRASDTERGRHWRPLARPQWLAPESMSDRAETLLATDALIDYVQARQRPLMVVADDQPAARPAFVVPDRGWPD